MMRIAMPIKTTKKVIYTTALLAVALFSSQSVFAMGHPPTREEQRVDDQAERRKQEAKDRAANREEQIRDDQARRDEKARIEGRDEKVEHIDNKAAIEQEKVENEKKREESKIDRDHDIQKQKVEEKEGWGN